MTNDVYTAIGIRDNPRARAITAAAGVSRHAAHPCEKCGETVLVDADNEELYRERSAIFRHIECCDFSEMTAALGVVKGKTMGVKEALARVSAGMRRN